MSGPTRFALVIGAMKSGTTSLFEYLAGHPAIAAATPKEPGYFAFPHVKARGDAWYLGLWRWDPARHRVALEASPYYTKLPTLPGVPDAVAAFGHAHAADVRILYMMRDPIGRMESHLRHEAQYHPARLVFRRRAVLDEALAYSSYAMQIAPWVERFGRDRVQLLVFEELSHDPEAVVRRVCRFLDVDPGHAFERLGEAHHVSNRRRAEITLLLRWSGFFRFRRLIPYAARQSVKTVARRWTDRSGAWLSPRERMRAIERLRPEVEVLAARYGVDVSRWTLGEDRA